MDWAMFIPILCLLLFLPVPALDTNGEESSEPTSSPCCMKKMVGGVPYTLVDEVDTSNYNCVSNCVYERDDIPEGGRFCFREGQLEVVCNEGPGGAGATTPEAGATTVGETTQSASARGEAAEAEKEAATEAKAEAESTKAAADESATTTAAVESKITDVIENAGSGRKIREATPTTCAAFNTLAKNMNTFITLKTKAGFTEATSLGKILLLVDANSITCDTNTLEALQTTKTKVAEAKTVISLEIALQQNKIKTAIESINKAIAVINAVNEELVAAGKTTFADPGTTLATVTAPTLPTIATTTGGSSTKAGIPVAGGTTSTGGAGATTPEIGAGATTPTGGAG